MPAPASITCLVVDDQQTIRSLVRSGLQQLGFTNIHEAADGEDGLRHMLARPVQLVISDYNMPKLDGLGLLRAIRAHPPIQ
jgi:two-component system chemotaxis response regulator CheY